MYLEFQIYKLFIEHELITLDNQNKITKLTETRDPDVHTSVCHHHHHISSIPVRNY